MQKFVPHEAFEREIVVVNSRFISSLAPAATVEEARDFIKEIRTRYPDASHHVPAYVIGSGNSVIAHCNDDGEPSGTAGRPALAVLQGSGIGDAVVVVTRYFGGTKLGKGGLVRAYGDAVREVLQHAKIAVIVLTDQLRITLEYPYYEALKRLFLSSNAVIEDEEFTDKVTLLCRIDSDRSDSLQSEIQELTSGRAHIDRLEKDQEYRKPLNQTIFDLQNA